MLVLTMGTIMSLLVSIPQLSDTNKLTASFGADVVLSLDSLTQVGSDLYRVNITTPTMPLKREIFIGTLQLLNLPDQETAVMETPFLFLPPSLLSIDPVEATNEGGEEVHLVLRYVPRRIRVFFGDTEAASVRETDQPEGEDAVTVLLAKSHRSLELTPLPLSMTDGALYSCGNGEYGVLGTGNDHPPACSVPRQLVRCLFFD
jgi:hypothetical protein